MQGLELSGDNVWVNEPKTSPEAEELARRVNEALRDAGYNVKGKGGNVREGVKSVASLCRDSGLGESVMTKVRKGEHVQLAKDMLAWHRIAKTLGIRLAWLFAEEEPKARNGDALRAVDAEIIDRLKRLEELVEDPPPPAPSPPDHSTIQPAPKKKRHR